MFKKKAQLILILALLSSFVWMKLSAAQAQTASGKERAQILLGKRLFYDARFSSPKGDLPASCSNCHLFNEDPQGLRAFTEFFNRSWFSWRTEDPRRLHARNAPILFDVALHPQLHSDGEFASLEALVKGTFAGRPMGWLKGEEAQASVQMRSVLLEAGSTYPPQFKTAYGVELTKLNADETAHRVASAVAAFMRTLRSPMDSPYDRFVVANQLSELTNAKTYEALLARLEREESLHFNKGFDEEALRGMQIFFRTSGSSSGAFGVGNCVACHTPPLFTDFSFHNVGVSQADYDSVHGAGKFAALEISVNAARPVERLRMFPERGLPERADLGHWNLVDLNRSPLRKANESDAAFLTRMIGTFKTPTLRHLAFSQPYFHNGAFTDLLETLREKVRLSELARAGKLRAADEQLLRMRLSEADLAPLVKFLNTLNEELRVNY